jgi:hypothetical protein
MIEIDFYCNSFASASRQILVCHLAASQVTLSASGWVCRFPDPENAISTTAIFGNSAMSSIKDTPILPATFNRLAWSNLAAQSAEQIALAAAPIVAVLSLGVAEAETGLLQTALTAPFVLFAIPAGLLIDHIPRRTLMAGAEAVRATALAAIVLLIWLGWLTLPWLALRSGTRRRSGWVGRGRTGVRICRGPLRDCRGAARRHLRAGAAERCTAPSAAGDPRALLRPVFVTQFIFNAGSFLLLAVFVPYARAPTGDGRRVLADLLIRHCEPSNPGPSRRGSLRSSRSQ